MCRVVFFSSFLHYISKGKATEKNLLNFNVAHNFLVFFFCRFFIYLFIYSFTLLVEHNFVIKHTHTLCNLFPNYFFYKAIFFVVFSKASVNWLFFLFREETTEGTWTFLIYIFLVFFRLEFINNIDRYFPRMNRECWTGKKCA